MMSDPRQASQLRVLVDTVVDGVILIDGEGLVLMFTRPASGRSAMPRTR